MENVGIVSCGERPRGMMWEPHYVNAPIISALPLDQFSTFLESLQLYAPPRLCALASSSVVWYVHTPCTQYIRPC